MHSLSWHRLTYLLIPDPAFWVSIGGIFQYWYPNWNNPKYLFKGGTLLISVYSKRELFSLWRRFYVFCFSGEASQSLKKNNSYDYIIISIWACRLYIFSSLCYKLGLRDKHVPGKNVQQRVLLGCVVANFGGLTHVWDQKVRIFYCSRAQMTIQDYKKSKHSKIVKNFKMFEFLI